MQVVSVEVVTTGQCFAVVRLDMCRAVWSQRKVPHCIKKERRFLSFHKVHLSRTIKMSPVRQVTVGVAEEMYRDQPIRNLRQSTLEIIGKVHNHYGLDPANH